MRKIKQLVGILLILASLGGLGYWETTGREQFTTEEVLVAKNEIEKGTVIRREMFKVSAVRPENLLPGVIRPEDISAVEGKAAAHGILKNQQIAEALFCREAEVVPEEYAPFMLKGEWISHRSSSLRSGNVVGVYSHDGGIHFGDYRIAVVLDAGEQEVGAEGGMIQGVEVLVDMEHYQEIRAYIESNGSWIMLVQKGEGR